MSDNAESANSEEIESTIPQEMVETVVQPAEDKVVTALKSRARDLSMALTPEAVARNLRDELSTRFPGVKHLYYIGAELKQDGTMEFEIATKTPNLGLSLRGIKSVASEFGAELGFNYARTTDNGWKIEIGLSAVGNFHPPSGSKPVSGGKFSVMFTK